MADPRRHRALGQIAVIRAVERGAARQELVLAGQREAEAHDAERRAEAHIVAAAAAWREQLSQGFLPEFARALAGELVASADAGNKARLHTEDMARDHERSAAECCASDARLEHSETLLAASRRALARDREERQLEALADRVTFAWSRA